MWLVILHGPPAVGKLTVATELAKLTGFKLFHNHLTLDLARELYPRFDDTLFDLVGELRFVVIRYAAQHDTDLIFTVAYTGSDDDDARLAAMVDVVAASGGQLALVRLTASVEDLMDRVTHESRRRFNKLTRREPLRQRIGRGEHLVTTGYDGVLEVDTSRHDPSTAAALIMEHFGLPEVRDGFG